MKNKESFIHFLPNYSTVYTTDLYHCNFYFWSLYGYIIAYIIHAYIWCYNMWWSYIIIVNDDILSLCEIKSHQFIMAFIWQLIICYLSLSLFLFQEASSYIIIVNDDILSLCEIKSHISSILKCYCGEVQGETIMAFIAQLISCYLSLSLFLFQEASNYIIIVNDDIASLCEIKSH